jgi:hypothetical protein
MFVNMPYIEEALYICEEEALYVCEKALYICEEALYIFPTMYFPKFDLNPKTKG